MTPEGFNVESSVVGEALKLQELVFGRRSLVPMIRSRRRHFWSVLQQGAFGVLGLDALFSLEGGANYVDCGGSRTR